MWITTEFVDFLQPTIRVGLYVLRVVWQSPHLCKLLKTNGRYADKGEVGGSSPPRPTIRSWSGPDTWVTQRTDYIGNTFGPNGFSSGSNTRVSRSKYPKS